MTTAPTEPAPDGAPADGSPPVWGGVVVLLVALSVLALLVLPRLPDGGPPLAGCTGPARPPVPVVEGARQVHAALPSRGADVEVSCRPAAGVPAAAAGAGPPGDPSSWAVVVRVDVSQDDDVVPAARALLAAARPDVGFTWDLMVRHQARSTDVGLAPGGEAQPAELAAELWGIGDVEHLWSGPDGVRVTVAAPEDVGPTLAALRTRELPAATVFMHGRGVDVLVEHAVPAAWPDEEVVDLVLHVAEWDGVWHVRLDGTRPDRPVMEIEVEHDAQRTALAAELDARAGPSLAYRLTSTTPAGSVDGVVGSRSPMGEPVTGATPTDGVPPCTDADLDLTVVGWDAALGARFLILGATHRGDAPCAVQGVPEVSFGSASGAGPPPPAQAAPGGTGSEPPEVVLDPGHSLVADVRWRAASPDPELADHVAVRAVTGGAVVRLPLSGGFDVPVTATAEARPWQLPAAAPWAPEDAAR